MPTTRVRRVHRPIALLPTFCVVRHGAGAIGACPFLFTRPRQTARCLLTKEYVHTERFEEGERYARTNECLNTISMVLIAVDVTEVVPDAEVEKPRIPGADVPPHGDTSE